MSNVCEVATPSDSIHITSSPFLFPAQSSQHRERHKDLVVRQERYLLGPFARFGEIGGHQAMTFSLFSLSLYIQRSLDTKPVISVEPL